MGGGEAGGGGEQMNADQCGMNCPEEMSGPMRETAQGLLLRILETKRRELVALETLAKIVDKTEPGSPLEALLWAMLSRRHESYL